MTAPSPPFSITDAEHGAESEAAVHQVMKDASTQWRPQHARRRYRGFMQPNAWVPPGLHVVPPPSSQHQQEPLLQRKVKCPPTQEAQFRELIEML